MEMIGFIETKDKRKSIHGTKIWVGCANWCSTILEGWPWKSGTSRIKVLQGPWNLLKLLQGSCPEHGWFLSEVLSYSHFQSTPICLTALPRNLFLWLQVPQIAAAYPDPYHTLTCPPLILIISSLLQLVRPDLTWPQVPSVPIAGPEAHTHCICNPVIAVSPSSLLFNYGNCLPSKLHPYVCTRACMHTTYIQKH